MPINPLFSILIPVRNAGEYLRECLISVQTQTMDDWECVIVNDGSSDDSVKIANSFSQEDSRFKLIHNTGSNGLIEALNLGLKHCQGEYVSRLDGDDLMPPNRLELHLQEFAHFHASEHGHSCGNYSSPNASEYTPILLTGKVQYFPEQNVSRGYKSYEQWLNSLHEPVDYLRNCLKECPVAAPSWSARIADVHALGGFTPGVYPEDYHFMLRALEQGWKFFSIPYTVLHWRQHQSRTSVQSDNYSSRAFWKIKSMHLRNILDLWQVNLNRPIWLVGSGSTAKEFMNAYDSFLDFAGIVTIHQYKTGLDYNGLPMVSPNDARLKGGYFLIVAGKAQKEIRQWLENTFQAEEGRDYLFMC